MTNRVGARAVLAVSWGVALAAAGCARSETVTLGPVDALDPTWLTGGASGSPSAPASAGGAGAGERASQPAQVAGSASADPDRSPPAFGQAMAPAARAPAQCRLSRRATVVASDHDSFVVAAAVDGDRFGLLWLRESTPWSLLFRTFTLAGEPLSEALELTQPQTRPQAALVAQGDTFVAAWRDLRSTQRIHVTSFADGAIVRDQTVAGSETGDDPVLAIDEAGGLVLSWARAPSAGRFERVVARSRDGGASVGDAWVLDSGAERPVFASSHVLSSALGHAWVARTITPNRSALRYTRSTADGLVMLDALTLVEHERYIYDTAIAVSAGRVAIATTDSRVNIGTVPLYLTLLEPDGTLIAEGIRLTNDHGHEHLDMAAGTRSFVIIADAFVGEEAETRVFLRQFDLDGRPLFSPISLTAEKLPAGTRLSQEPRLVALGPDRYLALWGERALHEPGTAYDLIAGIVDCAEN